MKQFVVQLKALALFCCLLVHVSQFVFAKEPSKMSVSQKNFADYLPEEIECVDIGYSYLGNGIKPQQKNRLYNNIIPEWGYCLAGYYRNLSKTHYANDPFYMAMAVSVISTGKSDHNGKLDNPLPQNIDDVNDDVNFEQLHHIQRDIGLFFCPYHVKVGDIFPLADAIYYVDKPFHVRKMLINSSPNFSIKRTPGTLCVPLSSHCHEIASQSALTYFPGLNVTVTRIYSVLAQNGSIELIARVCTVESSNITGISSGDRFNDYIGSPCIKRKADGSIDVEAERMIVQELKTKDIIKGDGVGYRITSIVPPEVESWRTINGLPEGIKGRVIGWVEIDPTPIPLDEEGNPISEKVKEK
ncbi:MAG: hypothetical protein ACRC2T_03950 [Thermoguttaceae bacterium]